jgi:hypothetical protein
MSEPTSALSIEGLVLRIAREIGVADYGDNGQGIAMIPTDPHDLDLCRRVVRDGIRAFIAAAPPVGWRWMRRIMRVTMTNIRVTGTADSASDTTLVDATLTTAYPNDDDLNGWFIYIDGSGSYAEVTAYTAATGTITISNWLDARGNTGGTAPGTDSTYAITPVETVGGDTHRYPLAENFGGSVDGAISYDENTSHSSIIDWVDESFIRQRRAVTIQTGYPLFAATKALEPYASGSGPTRRFEILFDPKPTSEDSILFPYSVYFDEVSIDTGIATGGSGTTLINSDLANLYPDDYYNGQIIKIMDGTGANSNAIVTDYESTTGTFTVADWLFIAGTAGAVDPASASTYLVQPVNNLHPAGMRFDQAIKSACLAQAEEDVDELAGRGFLSKFRKLDLPDALKLDMRAAPRSLGTTNKSGRGRNTLHRRNWNNVTFS